MTDTQTRDETFNLEAIDDDTWVEWSDRYEAEVKAYFEAVDWALEHEPVRVMGHRLLVQVMPRERLSGAGLLTDVTDVPRDGEIPIRYGTVLAVGEGFGDEVEPGDTAVFSNLLGLKFGGRFYPFDLPDGVEDTQGRAAPSGSAIPWQGERALELRFFRMGPPPEDEAQYYEMLGLYEYPLPGETVKVDLPGADSVEVEALDQSVLLGGIVEVDLPDKGRTWVPQRYVDRPGGPAPAAPPAVAQQRNPAWTD